MKQLSLKFLQVMVCLSFNFTNVHAELVLNKAVSQKQALQAIVPMQKETIWPYAEQHTFVFDKDTSIPYRPNSGGVESEKSVFAWKINEQTYYSYVVHYVPDNEPIEGCENYPPVGSRLNWDGPRCHWINWRHLVCHLFMMTEQGQIAGIGRVQIARDSGLIKGKPFCYDVRAMSAPKEINDSMLITVSYIDSAAEADPRVSPDEFPMTVLLRFKQEADGKLDITQDEQCLPNPNRIASIRQARQVLKAKGCLK